MNIINILAANNFFIFNKDIAKNYGTNVALLLGSLCNRYSYYQKKKELLIIDGKEYFFCIREHIYNDTGLTEYFQRQATKILENLGILQIKRKGIPSKNFYHINTQKLNEILEDTSPSPDEEQDVNGVNSNNNNINIISDTNNPDFISSEINTEKNSISKNDKCKEKKLTKKQLLKIEQEKNDLEISNIISQFTENSNIQKLLRQYVDVRKQKGLSSAQVYIMLEDLKSYCGNDLAYQEMCIRKAIAGGWSQIVFIDNFKSNAKTNYSSVDNTKNHFVGFDKIDDDEFNKLTRSEKIDYLNHMAIADMTEQQKQFFDENCLATDEDGNILTF